MFSTIAKTLALNSTRTSFNSNSTAAAALIDAPLENQSFSTSTTTAHIPTLNEQTLLENYPGGYIYPRSYNRTLLDHPTYLAKFPPATSLTLQQFYANRLPNNYFKYAANLPAGITLTSSLQISAGGTITKTYRLNYANIYSLQGKERIQHISPTVKLSPVISFEELINEKHNMVARYKEWPVEERLLLGRRIESLLVDVYPNHQELLSFNTLIALPTQITNLDYILYETKSGQLMIWLDKPALHHMILGPMRNQDIQIITKNKTQSALYGNRRVDFTIESIVRREQYSETAHIISAVHKHGDTKSREALRIAYKNTPIKERALIFPPEIHTQFNEELESEFLIKRNQDVRDFHRDFVIQNKPIQRFQTWNENTAPNLKTQTSLKKKPQLDSDLIDFSDFGN